ncbi:MAG: hypothetical protein E7620_00805 [Ruminococcaceae bacterium]|nr:hypothetical protein [Oscillospiraceae bacterium]
MAQETRPLAGGKHLEYMGKPLVRQDDTICYGDMSEKYILILEILKRDKETDLPSKILIQVVESQNPTNIIKQGDKNSLHDAFSLGTVWLEQALKKG